MKSNSIEINDLTLGQARELAALFSGVAPINLDVSKPSPDHPYEVGKNYFLRTVTHHLTGKLVSVSDKELVLIEAAWIADDGKLSNALAKGVFNEVEMFPDRPVIVGRAALIDAVTIDKLPTSTK